MEQKYIYVVFSATPYQIGKLIRKFTKETYNHVSIALDPELIKLYGFARRYYHTPFYGGFVRESLSRYHVKGKVTRVCICKLPVSSAQYTELEALLQQMHTHTDTYLYNHFSVLGALFRKPIRVKDAYTCVEFGVNILHKLGFVPDSHKYYTVGNLQQLLDPYTIYTGDIYPYTEYDTAYYTRWPVPFPILTSIRDICRLIPRLAKK